MSPVHPDNALNELTGEAWLYFTKSGQATAAYLSGTFANLKADAQTAIGGVVDAELAALLPPVKHNR